MTDLPLLPLRRTPKVVTVSAAKWPWVGNLRRGGPRGLPSALLATSDALPPSCCLQLSGLVWWELVLPFLVPPGGVLFLLTGRASS
jgi:hypothetical protein